MTEEHRNQDSTADVAAGADVSKKERPPLKWLYDRIKGKSKVGDSRPPHPMCYVPPPVGRWPEFFEQNTFCKFWGRIGIINPDNENARYWLLHIGFVANVIGFFLTLYSCLAISNNYEVLKAAAYSMADISTQDVENVDGSVSIDLGLRGVALMLPNFDGPIVIPFTDFCDLPDEELKSYLNQGTGEDGELCGVCEEVSRSMVWSIMFSVLTFVPSFTTNVLRLYSNYDVNCQKGFSTLFASVTLILSMNTLLRYNNQCFAAFYSGSVPFDRNLDPLDDDNTEPFFTVEFDWNAGPGLICLYLGTVLKAIDIGANMLVPSPSITRDEKEQLEYELLPEPDAEPTRSRAPPRW